MGDGSLKDDMGYTAEERMAILNRMRLASDTFYGLAAASGCHAFIEFTGLMNEFIKLCADAEAAGIPWVHANVHGPVHLPFKPYHMAYLSEKLECIYGAQVRLDDGDRQTHAQVPGGSAGASRQD